MQWPKLVLYYLGKLFSLVYSESSKVFFYFVLFLFYLFCCVFCFVLFVCFVLFCFVLFCFLLFHFEKYITLRHLFLTGIRMVNGACIDLKFKLFMIFSKQN